MFPWVHAWPNEFVPICANGCPISGPERWVRALKLVDIDAFNTVANTMSFTRAAEMLGVSRSAISKRIARLERETGVMLFQRSARSIRLTVAGERLYEESAELDSLLQRAREAVKSAPEEPFGRLSITMPTSLGAQFTPLLVTEFQHQWPHVELEINLDERYADLSAEGIDVAIRVAKRLSDSGQRAKKLAASPEILVASPGYLKQHGTPIRWQELRHHRCLALAKRNTAWRLSGSHGPETIRLDSVTTFNNDLAMILAGALGAGILLTPRILVESELKLGRLIPVLPEFSAQTDYAVWAVYRTTVPTSNARIFVDFVEQWLPRLGDMDRWNPLQNSIN